MTNMMWSLCIGTILVLIAVFFASYAACGEVVRPTEYVWPPEGFVSRYCPHAVGCKNRTGVTKDMIRTFSETDDLNNLPRDRELKCYMDCLLVSANMRTENSTTFNYVNIIEAMNRMPMYSQKILLHMSRGCIKYKKSQDGCENAYAVNLCLKTNDKEHYMIY